MNNEFLQKAFDIVISSTRPMPAYFTGNGEREKSFCVNFDIKYEDEYEMAFEVWQNPKYGFPAELNETLHHVMLKFAEDIMIGSYIITFLGYPELADDLTYKLINYNIESFPVVNKVKETASLPMVQESFKNCSKFGKELAIWTKTKKNKPENCFSSILEAAGAERKNKLTNN